MRFERQSKTVHGLQRHLTTVELINKRGHERNAHGPFLTFKYRGFIKTLQRPRP